MDGPPRVDSTQPRARFGWTKERQDTALLLAESDFTDEEIAQKLGISRDSITRWKRHPEFVAKVNALAAEYDARILRQGVARKTRRIQSYLTLIGRIEALIADRASAHGPRQEVEQPDGTTVNAGGDGAIGGGTGLVVREVKEFGRVRSETHSFDASLVRELRELKKQLAIELGEWQEKQQVSGTVSVEYVNDWRGQDEGG